MSDSGDFHGFDHKGASGWTADYEPHEPERTIFPIDRTGYAQEDSPGVAIFVLAIFVLYFIGRLLFG